MIKHLYLFIHLFICNAELYKKYVRIYLSKSSEERCFLLHLVFRLKENALCFRSVPTWGQTFEPLGWVFGLQLRVVPHVEGALSYVHEAFVLWIYPLVFLAFI